LLKDKEPGSEGLRKDSIVLDVVSGDDQTRNAGPGFHGTCGRTGRRDMNFDSSGPMHLVLVRVEKPQREGQWNIGCQKKNGNTPEK